MKKWFSRRLWYCARSVESGHGACSVAIGVLVVIAVDVDAAVALARRHSLARRRVPVLAQALCSSQQWFSRQVMSSSHQGKSCLQGKASHVFKATFVFKSTLQTRQRRCVNVVDVANNHQGATERGCRELGMAHTLFCPQHPRFLDM